MNDATARGERVSIEKILKLDTAKSSLLADRRVQVGAALIAVLITFGLLWMLSGTQSSVRYVTAPVSRGPLVVVVTATGSVQPTNKVDVSSELSGTIRRVLVDYNSPVKAGQSLAELDTEKLDATVASSRAKLVAARARVADAEATMLEKQRDLVRKKLLEGKQITSTQNLELAQAAYDRAVAAVASAKADVGVAEAELKLNETNRAKACICSPIDGVVLKRSAEPGQTVASSLQAPVLFSIAEDLTQMELQVDVDEADVGKVKAGQKATFSVDAFPDRRFPATIRDVRFASETIQGVVTYKAVLTIDNSELLLRPGMTATAEIRVAEVDDALLVANAALRYAPPSNTSATQRSFLQRLLPGRPAFRQASRQEAQTGTRTVWVLENGKPAAVTIRTGATDGRNTEVTGGDLKAGQNAIVDQTAVRS
ncbi:MAG: efflux RND transporter periplasmic adaptor subunit [Hyphomicrobiaceae bacterium]